MTYQGFTLDELHRLFCYDPATGVIRWRVTVTSRAPAGGEAGTPDSSGYRRVKLNGKVLYAHRLAFFLFHGWLPDCIDHKNLNRQDNRVSNIRAADATKNVANQPVRRTNALGVKGVHVCGHTGRYRVRIKVAGKNLHLGRFDNIDDAHTAYLAAAQRIHGEFARG